MGLLTGDENLMSRLEGAQDGRLDGNPSVWNLFGSLGSPCLMLNGACTALRERFHGIHASVKLTGKDGATSILISRPNVGGNLPASYNGLQSRSWTGWLLSFGATLGSRFSMVQATMCHGGAPKALCIPT